MRMPNCREVTTAIASDDLARRPWSERLLVRLHLMMCRHCRRYAAQLAAIGDAVRRLYRREPSNDERLRQTILESLHKR